jgi:folate-binding protein YgfZ
MNGPSNIPSAGGDEYAAALCGAGLHDRSYRGLIEIAGRDRAAWLSNLTTNSVTTLTPGEGNYAFALNAKGRILVDGNVLVMRDVIWLDVDRSHIAAAMKHLDRYIITEDVSLRDRSDEFARPALLGPKIADVFSSLGARQAAAMAQLQHGTLTLAGKPRVFVRHDFAGVPGVELFVESPDAEACRASLARFGLRPIGLATVQTLRIEAGIPWPGADIDEDVLPAETLQVERGVSYQKGCYLGQEVVERMRSRGALARRLTGVRIDGEVLPDVSAKLRADGVEIGRLTSVCRSPAAGGLIGLGYAKTSHAAPGTPVHIVAANGDFAGHLAQLPFR